MRRWTTPTHTIRVKGADLTGCDVWVTYTQRSRQLEVFDPPTVLDGEDSVITVELTQEQTSTFSVGTPVDVQVNWVTPEGARDATVTKAIEVTRNDLNREQGYVGND